MANARSVAGEQQMGFIDKQLEFMRLHIESINSSIKAAAVDAQLHGHNVSLQMAGAKQAAKPVKQGQKRPTPIDTNAPHNPMSLSRNVRNQLPITGGNPPDQGEQPPVPGARKAPDGQWYVNDPTRPGGYLRVVPNTGQPNTGQ
jgi:hypothetical protein